MKQAFADGVDIHALTASEMFGVPLDEMTSEVRRKAKANYLRHQCFWLGQKYWD